MNANKKSQTIQSKPAKERTRKAAKTTKKATRKTTKSTTLASPKRDWPTAFAGLIRKYGKRKHPLDYETPYQLFVKVTLSAQSSDVQINSIAPAFFKTYPTFGSLLSAKPEDLFPLISSVRNFANKARWLCGAAKVIQNEKLPLTMEELTALPGIGRKSANVLLRELGGKTEGIVVDLHVLRVAPRLGISKEEVPAKVEADLMKALPERQWKQAGMCISFLGRDICRPKEPLCGECVMNEYCDFVRGKG